MVVVRAKARNNQDLNAASIQVSMILIGDKIESVTLEVGLIDAVSSSPALKEIWGVFVLKAGCYKLVSEPWFK
ncbi:hypothetical protein L2E82_01595 [Cichorium intybus]|uniref:Uncharacterized protein n=1 Tax=Cichorium intybus TaxID=13427 RepID=A0ACB9H1H5_CICIN|nr:hypothetical protein L2E82_01595 [Cichorium intybus]